MRQKLFALVLVCMSFLQPLSARAQQTDFEGWFQFIGNVRLDDEEKWIWTFEEQPRLGDDWKKLQTNIIRNMVSYNFSKQFSAGVGYYWGPTFYNSHYQSVYRDENRTFVQLLYRHDRWGMQWLHRFRQEQRFIENTDGAVSNRSRYMLRGSYPIAEDKSWGLTGYNEIFVNENGVPNGPKGGYDQDRVFFGPYMKVGRTRYEVGYLEQQIQRFGSAPRWAQVLVFAMSVDF